VPLHEVRPSLPAREAKGIDRGLCHGKTDPAPSMAQAIAESLARLQRSLGGKSLVSYFDGREGAEVAQSTLSRWISEPRRFPAVFVGVLAELDPAFRAYLVGALFVSDLVGAVTSHETPAAETDALRHRIERRFLDLAYGLAVPVDTDAETLRRTAGRDDE